MSNKFKISTSDGIKDSGSNDTGIVEISGPSVTAVNSQYNGQNLPQLRIGSTNDDSSIMVGIHKHTENSNITMRPFIQTDINNNYSELHIQPNGGNIHIGIDRPITDKPVFKVYGDIDVEGTVKKNGVPVNFSAVPPNGGVKWFYEDQTDNIVYTAGSTINEGKVGIGTNNPISKLHIIGNVKVEGNIDYNGILFSNGVNFEESLTVNDKKQTLFQLLSEQPNQFTFDASSNTSGTLTLNWNYDEIIPKDKTLTNISFFASGSNNKDKALPYIDQIIIELSGNINTGNNAFDQFSGTWVQYNQDGWPKTLPSTDSYNSNTYKTVTFNKTVDSEKNNDEVKNILSKLDTFDVRIYGINNGNDYPSVDDRALYFNGVGFLEPQAPSQPTVNNIQLRNDGGAVFDDVWFDFNLAVSNTENGVPDSTARIIEADISYSEINTLASNDDPSTPTSPLDTQTNVSQTYSLLDNLNNNDNILFDNLKDSNGISIRAGSQYNFNVRAKNQLTTNFSTESAVQTTAFTYLPSNRNIGTVPDFSPVSGSTWSLLGLGSGNIYINKSYLSYKFTPNNPNQKLEITKPRGNSISQQTETSGFGQYIDGLSNLMNIKVDIDGDVKQEVSFNGFSNPQKIDNNTQGNDYSFISNITNTDIWNDSNYKKGFRLKAGFTLNNIDGDDLSTLGLVPKQDAYVLKYTYTRDSDMGGSNKTEEFDVYFDDLNSQPNSELSKDEHGDIIYPSLSITSVEWTMGVPSVGGFNSTFTLNYTNINSSNKFISSDGIIAKITSVSNMYFPPQTFSENNRNNLDTNGNYTETYTNIPCYFNTNSYSESDQQNNINEKVYSLRYLNGVTITSNKLITRYHVDKQNYNTNNMNNGPLRNVNFSKVFELDSNGISNISGNLGAISKQSITHTSVLNDRTALFYKNQWTVTGYPNISAYDWTGFTITASNYNYTSSGTNIVNIGYQLDGTQSTSGDRYKWIIFEINDSTYNNSSYLDLTSILNNSNYRMSTSQINSLLSDSDNTVIGFIHHDGKVGNLSKPFLGTNTWYGKPNYNISYSQLDSSAYGSKHSSGDGPQLEPGAAATISGATPVHIYVGFKL